MWNEIDYKKCASRWPLTHSKMDLGEVLFESVD